MITLLTSNSAARVTLLTYKSDCSLCKHDTLNSSTVARVIAVSASMRVLAGEIQDLAKKLTQFLTLSKNPTKIANFIKL